jgi:hypothetical protein
LYEKEILGQESNNNVNHQGSQPCPYYSKEYPESLYIDKTIVKIEYIIGSGNKNEKKDQG